MSIQFQDREQFVQWNEAMARRYNPEAYHLESNWAIRWIERRRVQAILSYLDAGPQDSVLEVGCGAGNVLEQVPTGQLYGVDLSAFLIGRSQARLARRKARLVRADAQDLPLVSGSFDRLVCSEVLEHVPDPRRILEEMARVARPEAVIVLSVPNEDWIDRLKQAARRMGWKGSGGTGGYHVPSRMTDEWHLLSFDLDLLKEVCRGLLEIREVASIPFNAVPLRYVACCRLADQCQECRDE